MTVPRFFCPVNCDDEEPFCNTAIILPVRSLMGTVCLQELVSGTLGGDFVLFQNIMAITGDEIGYRGGGFGAKVSVPISGEALNVVGLG